jgi:hypothetical protein
MLGGYPPPAGSRIPHRVARRRDRHMPVPFEETNNTNFTQCLDVNP